MRRYFLALILLFILFYLPQHLCNAFTFKILNDKNQNTHLAWMRINPTPPPVYAVMDYLWHNPGFPKRAHIYKSSKPFHGDLWRDMSGERFLTFMDPEKKGILLSYLIDKNKLTFRKKFPITLPNYKAQKETHFFIKSFYVDDSRAPEKDPVIYIANARGTLQSTDLGQSWKVISKKPFRSAMQIARDKLFLVFEQHLLYSNSGGLVFQEMPLAKYGNPSALFLPTKKPYDYFYWALETARPLTDDKYELTAKFFGASFSKKTQSIKEDMLGMIKTYDFGRTFMHSNMIPDTPTSFKQNYRISKDGFSLQKQTTIEVWEDLPAYREASNFSYLPRLSDAKIAYNNEGEMVVFFRAYHLVNGQNKNDFDLFSSVLKDGKMTTPQKINQHPNRNEEMRDYILVKDPAGLLKGVAWVSNIEKSNKSFCYYSPQGTGKAIELGEGNKVAGYYRDYTTYFVLGTKDNFIKLSILEVATQKMVGIIKAKVWEKNQPEVFVSSGNLIYCLWSELDLENRKEHLFVSYGTLTDFQNSKSKKDEVFPNMSRQIAVGEDKDGTMIFAKDGRKFRYLIDGKWSKSLIF